MTKLAISVQSFKSIDNFKLANVRRGVDTTPGPLLLRGKWWENTTWEVNLFLSEGPVKFFRWVALSISKATIEPVSSLSVHSFPIDALQFEAPTTSRATFRALLSVSLRLWSHIWSNSGVKLASPPSPTLILTSHLSTLSYNLKRQSICPGKTAIIINTTQILK